MAETLSDHARGQKSSLVRYDVTGVPVPVTAFLWKPEAAAVFAVLEADAAISVVSGAPAVSVAGVAAESASVAEAL